MIDTQSLDRVIGSEVYGPNGDKIGKVGQLYLDDASGRPTWVTVNTGLFGTKENFVPVQYASISGDRVTVPYDKSKVKDAPQVADDGHISPEEEEELYRYYGLSYGNTTQVDYAKSTQRSGLAGGGQPGSQAGDAAVDRSAEEGVVGHDTSGPTTDTAMTRSEEQLRVGTETREAGRARLRKYVTTETQTHTVPVTKERAVVEREPITDANAGAALDGPQISEDEHEVVLREEAPVVEKTATPVERVRLGTEQVAEQETVSGEVRKEHIDVDGDARGR
jgi:uncharacterized protein (TIGR02271 family)